MTSTRSSFFQGFQLSVKNNVINLNEPPSTSDNYYKSHRKSSTTSTGNSSIASDGGSVSPTTHPAEGSPSNPNRISTTDNLTSTTIDLTRESETYFEQSKSEISKQSIQDMKKRPSLASYFGFSENIPRPIKSLAELSSSSELIVDVPNNIEDTKPSVDNSRQSILNIFNKPVDPDNNNGGVIRRYSFLNAFTSPQPPSPELADTVKMHSMEELLGFSEDDQRLSTTRDFMVFESHTVYDDPTLVDHSSKSFDLQTHSEQSILGLSISNRSPRGAALTVPPPMCTSPRSETSKQNFTSMMFPSNSKNFEALHLHFQTITDRLEGKDETLTEVDLNSSPLFSKSSEYYDQLVKALKSNRWIERLELANIGMDELELNKFISVFASCSHLKKLNLESNHLPCASIEALALMAETHPSLIELRLGSQKDVRTDKQSDKALANCLSRNFNIVKLTHKFHDKRIASYVAKCVKRNITYTRPSHSLAPRVSEAYPYPRDRTSSQISDQSPKNSMVSQPKMASLAASGASPTLVDETIDTLSGGISYESKQKRKSLLGLVFGGLTSGQSVSSKARESSAEATQFRTLVDKLISTDTTATSVSFRNSSLFIQHEEYFDLLCRGLNRNISVTKLELIKVSIQDDHVDRLCQAVASCVNLKVLNLEGNSMTAVGIMAIARMVEIHPSLHELRLGSQSAPIGVDGERALANALSQNTRITKLVFQFRDKNVAMFIDKFLNRNIEYEQKQRLSLQEGPVSPTAVKASIPGFDLFSPTRARSTGSFKSDPYPFTMDKGLSKYVLKR